MRKARFERKRLHSAVTQQPKGNKMSSDFSNLERPRHPMPDFVKTVLEEQGLMNDYEERPAYQQNDYIGWINRAKRQETKEKRLRQMLDELRVGGVYMGMEHPPSKKGYTSGSGTQIPNKAHRNDEHRQESGI